MSQLLYLNDPSVSKPNLALCVVRHVSRINVSRAPLFTCCGRAVGLLSDWSGGYAKTVSGYGKWIQRSQADNRPRPIRVAARSRCAQSGHQRGSREV